MKKLFGCFGIIVVISLSISFMMNFWTYITNFFWVVLIIGLLLVWYQKSKVNQAMETAQQQQLHTQNTTSVD